MKKPIESCATERSRPGSFSCVSPRRCGRRREHLGLVQAREALANEHKATRELGRATSAAAAAAAAASSRRRRIGRLCAVGPKVPVRIKVRIASRAKGSLLKGGHVAQSDALLPVREARAISLNQRSSVWQSDALDGNPWQSEALNGNPVQSSAIQCHQAPANPRERECCRRRRQTEQSSSPVVLKQGDPSLIAAREDQRTFCERFDDVLISEAPHSNRWLTRAPKLPVRLLT